MEVLAGRHHWLSLGVQHRPHGMLQGRNDNGALSQSPKAVATTNEGVEQQGRPHPHRPHHFLEASVFLHLSPRNGHARHRQCHSAIGLRAPQVSIQALAKICHSSIKLKTQVFATRTCQYDDSV